jgi:hypothetical protein
MSHSTIQDYIACNLKVYFRKVCGLEIKPEKKAHALKRGILWDTYQSVFYNEKKESDIYDCIEKYQIQSFDVIQIESLYKAFCELVVPNDKNIIGSQQKFTLDLKAKNELTEIDVSVIGIYDRLYSDHFAENKFTSNPDNYLNSPFDISSQVGTYFMANPKLMYVVMEIARVPQLRLGKIETEEQYGDRLYEDVLMRPSYYFPGYNFSKKSYGKVFYRSEFESRFDSLSSRYKIVAKEIVDRMKNNTWYECEQCCHLYNSQCDYYRICSTGNWTVSEELYMIDKRVV